MKPWFMALLFVIPCFGTENPYYIVEDILIGSTIHNSRDDDWTPGDGIALEATGLAALDNDRLAVAIRKGEIWMLDGPR